MKDCPLCFGAGLVSRPDAIVPAITVSAYCPNGCMHQVLADHRRLAAEAGHLGWAFFGLRPAGQSHCHPWLKAADGGDLLID